MSKFSAERFLRACGGLGPIRVLLENQESHSESVFVLDRPSILIGQHPNSDIRLRHPSIGKRHYYIQVLDGRLFGLSLAPQSSMRWYESPKPTGWISSEETIELGPYTLKFLEGIRPTSLEDMPPTNPMVSSPNGAPPICLEYRVDSSKVFRGVVNRPLSLVGRSELCKVRIHSEKVSTVHCSLVRTPVGIWVVDLGGREGFRLNGALCRVACLERGDQFELGGISFQIQYEAPVGAPSVAELTIPESLPLVERRPEPLILNTPISAAPISGDRENFERMIGPVLDHFTAFQNQTFQQFQELMMNVMQMFGSMFKNQQDFVRDEMKRFDKLTEEVMNLQQQLKSLPVAETAAPEPPYATPMAEAAPVAPKPRVAPPIPTRDANAPTADPETHVWLQTRIAELNEQRNTLWSRMMGMLRGRSTPPQ